jgi:hypothetical protein
MKVKHLHFFLIFIFTYSLAVKSQTKKETIETISKQYFLDENEARSYYDFRKNLIPTTNRSEQNKAILANCSNSGNLNIGFEQGNFSGWNIQRGTILNSLYDSIINVSPATTTKTLVTTGVDAITGFSYNSPFAGNYVIKLNDAINNTEATFMSTKFMVTPSNNILKTAFSFVNTMAGHSCLGDPYFRIQLFTCNRTNLIKEYLFINDFAYCTGYNPGFFNPVAYNNVVGYYYATDWKKLCFDLRNYVGQEVEINVVVSDCAYNGHFGYAYFDAEFGYMPNSLSLPTTYTLNNIAYTFTNNISSQCFNQGNSLLGQSTSTLIYPVGNSNYTTTSANSGISIAQSGTYDFISTPVTGCNILNDVKISIQPTITLAAPSPTACKATPTTFTISGSKEYTVKVNGIVYNNYALSNTLPSPITLMLYQNPSTVTVIGFAQTNCYDSASVVLPLYTQTSLTTVYTPTVCIGSTTVSASGAVTYSWNPTASGPIATITAVGQTYVSVIGTDILGCRTAQSTFSIYGQSSTPIGISGSTGPICLGDSSYISVTGAISYSWSNNFNGCCQFLKPTLSNQNFTVVASNVCTSNAVIPIVFNVVPGPAANSFSVNYSNNPVCPNQTFSVQGVGASFYMKWGPTGAYSNFVNAYVTAANPTFSAIAQGTNGCNTQSIITMVVLPTPTLAVTGNTTICSGQAATLSALGANTYTWDYFQSTPAYTTGTAVANFNVNLAGTSSLGCATNSNFPVIVENSGLTASPNTTNVCIGANTITLSGLPFASSGTYSWSTGATAQSIVVTPTTTTSYTLISNSGLCGIKINTITIVVNSNTVAPITFSNTPVCFGKAYTVTLNGASSYQLNYGPVFTVNTFTNVQSYTWPSNLLITGTLTNGCTTSTLISFTAGAIPYISAFGPPGNQGCKTSTVNITAYGASTYTWSNATTGSVTAITPSVNMAYSVIGTTTAGCTGTATTPVIFGVNPPTITITPPTPSVCPNSLFTLTGTAISGNNFLWSDSTNAAAMTNSVTMPTVFTLTCTNAFCVSTKTVLVNIYNPVTFSLSNSICTGANTVLNYSATPPGGTLYVNGIPSSSIFSFITNTFNVAYMYQDTGSCVLSTNTIITVNQSPCLKLTANNYSSCVGNPITFTGTPIGGNYIGSNLSGNVLNAPVAGNYTVSYSYTDVNNCSNTICTEVNVSICTDIEKNDLNKINLYPNPSHNAVTIENPNGGNVLLKIYDLNGKVLMDHKLENNSNQINISDYPYGLYIFYLETETDRKFIKVIKD